MQYQEIYCENLYKKRDLLWLKSPDCFRIRLPCLRLVVKTFKQNKEIETLSPNHNSCILSFQLPIQCSPNMEEKKCPGKNHAEKASIAICIAFLGLSKNLCISEKCLLCAKKVRTCLQFNGSVKIFPSAPTKNLQRFWPRDNSFDGLEQQRQRCLKQNTNIPAIAFLDLFQACKP